MHYSLIVSLSAPRFLLLGHLLRYNATKNVVNPMRTNGIFQFDTFKSGWFIIYNSEGSQIIISQNYCFSLSEAKQTV